MPPALKRASPVMPVLALCAGVSLIALEWRGEASTFWIIIGGVLIVLAVASLAFGKRGAGR